jgi:nitroreductase
MDFYNAVDARRTVRDFESRPVPREVLERIVGAGLKAPSNNHMREWEFLVLNDPAERLRAIRMVRDDVGVKESTAIVDAWGMTNERQRAMYLDAIPKQHKMLLTAGCLILPLFKQYGPLLNRIHCPLSTASRPSGAASKTCCWPPPRRASWASRASRLIRRSPI